MGYNICVECIVRIFVEAARAVYADAGSGDKGHQPSCSRPYYSTPLHLLSSRPEATTCEQAWLLRLADVDVQPPHGGAILEDEVARAVPLFVGGAHLEQVLLVQREGDLVRGRVRDRVEG